MASHKFRLDVSKPLAVQPDRGHNRWHPDIAPLLQIEPGDEVLVDTLDASEAQLRPNLGVEQPDAANLIRVHPLIGPVEVGAPGWAVVQPIKFDDFLDLPTVASISKESKRKTVMWHALNGTVLDVIGATEIPVPTQAAAVDACVKAIFENDLIKFGHPERRSSGFTPFDFAVNKDAAKLKPMCTAPGAKPRSSSPRQRR